VRRCRRLCCFHDRLTALNAAWPSAQLRDRARWCCRCRGQQQPKRDAQRAAANPAFCVLTCTSCGVPRRALTQTWCGASRRCRAQATRHAELEAIDALLAAHGGDAAAAGFERCAAAWWPRRVWCSASAPANSAALRLRAHLVPNMQRSSSTLAFLPHAYAFRPAAASCT
jgi:hypothetical protein